MRFKIAEQIATHERSEIALESVSFHVFQMVFSFSFSCARVVTFRGLNAKCFTKTRHAILYYQSQFAMRIEFSYSISINSSFLEIPPLMWNFTTCTRWRNIVISASDHIAVHESNLITSVSIFSEERQNILSMC